MQTSFDDSPALCAQLAPGPPAPRLYTSFLARGQGKGRLVLSWFSFFLRTMELLSLQFRQVRIFKNEGTVVIAIANSKTSGGVQQSLSLHEPTLVAVLLYLWGKIQTEGLIFAGSPATFRTEFAALARSVGLDPADYLPYCLPRGGATHFYQATQSLHGYAGTTFASRHRHRPAAALSFFVASVVASLTCTGQVGFGKGGCGLGKGPMHLFEGGLLRESRAAVQVRGLCSF